MQWFALEYRPSPDQSIGMIAFDSERNVAGSAAFGFVGCSSMQEALQRARLMEARKPNAYGVIV